MFCDYCKNDYLWCKMKTWIIEVDLDGKHKSTLRHYCPSCAESLRRYIDGEIE